MFKGFLVIPVLALLLTACAANQSSRPVQPDRMVPPQQPIATQAEKVITLVPRGEAAAAITPATPSPNLLADEEAQETAFENLRALLGVSQLSLAMKSAENSPNAINYPAVLFTDDRGNSYYISQDTLQPIEFTLQRPYTAENASPKTADELRAAADEIAKTYSTQFEALRESLYYTEGAKSGENFFYRWEMRGTDVGGMPAILQIGLKQDGTLFSYLNSIDLLP